MANDPDADYETAISAKFSPPDETIDLSICRSETLKPPCGCNGCNEQEVIDPSRHDNLIAVTPPSRSPARRECRTESDPPCDSFLSGSAATHSRIVAPVVRLDDFTAGIDSAQGARLLPSRFDFWGAGVQSGNSNVPRQPPHDQRRWSPTGGDVCLWQPSIWQPVSLGIEQVGPAQGAPLNMYVLYPTATGPAYGAPILEGCSNKFPIIVFVHGACNSSHGGTSFAYYEQWLPTLAALAGAGYVVLLYDRSGHEGAYDTDQYIEVNYIAELLLWVTKYWNAGDLLDASRTGIIGHSFGAVAALQFVAETGIPFAYASLSGVFTQFTDPTQQWLYKSLNIPSLFMLGTGTDDEKVGSSQPMQAANCDPAGHAREPFLWDAISDPVHSVVFDGGQHWDYLADFTCGESNGPCPVQWLLTGDVLVTFFSRYMPTVLTLPVREDLVPPTSVEIAATANMLAGGSYPADFLKGYMIGRNTFLKYPCAAFFRWRTLKKFGQQWLFNQNLTTPPWCPEPSGN